MQLRPHQIDSLVAMQSNTKGQVIVPTGGGKTMCMIEDAIYQFKSAPKTIVVVAPRILLAKQLCSEFREMIDIHPDDVMHVHSGDLTGKSLYFCSTQVNDVKLFHYANKGKNTLMFTTYHSLHKIVESGINVDTIYFDEAHNGVQKNFVEAVEYFSMYSARAYFFTATPKHSLTPLKVGMNDADIFGNVICQVPAPKLVEEGHILPPKVAVYKTRILEKDELVVDADCDQMINALDNIQKNKVLICAKSTKQITNLISQTPFVMDLQVRGYNWMFITSKTGAFVNGKKVSREEFFNTLNEWGVDGTKFVVLHHSILSEGINVKGLEAVLFMRSMDYIGISETIGRVIRKGAEDKVYGLVCVPVYSKVGISTARKVEAVVDTVFNKGQAATSVIRS